MCEGKTKKRAERQVILDGLMHTDFYIVIDGSACL